MLYLTPRSIMGIPRRTMATMSSHMCGSPLAERRWGSPHDQHSQRPDSTVNPFTPHSREGEGAPEWTHEELVQAFRQLIDTQIQEDLRFKGERHSLRTSPALIIRNALRVQEQFLGQSGYGVHERGWFYSKIATAWNVIAYDHYRTRDGVEDAWEQHWAADHLSVAYQRAKAMGEPRAAILKLAPRQVQILDALAEAAAIPHQRGQREIEIPERHRYYRLHHFGPDGTLLGF